MTIAAKNTIDMYMPKEVAPAKTGKWKIGGD